MDRWRLVLVLLLALACAACGQRRQPSPASPAGRLQYAELPGLRASPHAGLQAEFSLVEQEQGLPLQICPPRKESNPEREKPTPAAALGNAFPPISRALVLAQLDEVYPGGPLALSPVQIERGRELLARYAQACEQFRQALPALGEGFGIRPSDGALADVEFLDPLASGSRLEATAAAVALAENRPDDALPHLETMLSAARLLAAEPNVTLRVAAANLRADALEVLRAIAVHPQAARSTHEQLFAILTTQTADWPDDTRAWLGDRAGGLVVYELVRDGQYLALLTKEEAKSLEERKMVRVTAQAVMRNLDEDEAYYLRTMRQIIAACRLPYFEREPVLRELRGDLSKRADAADYPLVAGNVLLVDFETGHRRQADDFARCQGWILALGTALGEETPAIPASPLTGQAYEVESTPLAVTISGGIPLGDGPCMLPILPPREASPNLSGQPLPIR